ALKPINHRETELVGGTETEDTRMKDRDLLGIMAAILASGQTDLGTGQRMDIGHPARVRDSAIDLAAELLDRIETTWCPGDGAAGRGLVWADDPDDSDN
ncbi:MAG: hypothetical protein DRQ48_11410, partial [Gammaproteobacteria bacterium]